MDLKLQFPGLSRKKLISEDFPGLGNFWEIIQDFSGLSRMRRNPACHN